MSKQGPKLPNKSELVAYITPISSVSEGAKVQLDGTQSYYKISNTTSGGSAAKTIITTRIVRDKDDGISYFWKQIGGPKVTLENENAAKPSFIAPLVDIYESNNDKPKIYNVLKFQLVVKDKGNVESKPVSEEVIVKIVQRALILQGGGSLGAYEVGVIKALVENIINKNSGIRPIFDIIAGTSIGAVNAAILVGNIIKLQKENPNLKQAEIWKSAIKHLEAFWQEISDPLTMVPEWIRNTPIFDNLLNNSKVIIQLSGSLFDAWWHLIRATRESWHQYYVLLSKQTQRTNEIKKMIFSYYGDGEKISNYFQPYIPIFADEWPYIIWISYTDNSWKEEMPYIQNYFYWPENYSPLATAEALRRYNAVAKSLISGVPKVLTPSIPQADMKFFGPTFIRMDNTPLVKTIKKYWDYEKFPIKTNFKYHQPRLLLVSVDALDSSTPVVFDSYAKENNVCKTVYGDEEYRHEIEYPNGIRSEHVMASMAVHLKHRYPKMKVRSNVGEEAKREEERYFWDGAYLSNTPLREVLWGHRNYWRDIVNEEAKLENGRIEIVVPDTDVYIINLYPPVETELPTDADTIQDREIDIKFHDRTKYDVRLAEITTDYIELIEQLESLALKHSEDDEAFKQDYNDLLNNVTKSKTRIGTKQRVYRDLIEGRFDIHKVTYIERIDDGNTIFGKASEFSSKTVNQLKEAGYQDAQDTIEFETLRDIINNLINKEIITKEKGISMQQNLHAARVHIKHQNMDKAIDLLNVLVKYTKDITIAEKSIEKSISQFINSTLKLKFQFAIENITVMVNKDIITEDQGDSLKQRLQKIKAPINDQSCSNNKNVEAMLQQFIDDVNNLIPISIQNN